jgi:hypothetical protein
MARINKKNNISGRINNLIFFDLNGEQFVKAASDTIMQTKATKLSSGEFIKCSKWTKQIRLSLSPILLTYTDTYMYKRFTARFYAALQTNTTISKEQRSPWNSDLSGLTGFEFNSHSPFSNYFFPTIIADINEQNKLVITIPEFETSTEMVFSENTGKAELIIFSVAINLESYSPILAEHFMIPIERHTLHLSETIVSNIAIPAKHFIVVLAKLMYYLPNSITIKNYINHKEFNPSTIIMAKHTL